MDMWIPAVHTCWGGGDLYGRSTLVDPRLSVSAVVCVWADVNQTEPADGVKEPSPNVNHNNLPNSEPGTGAGDATAAVSGLVLLW